MALIDSKQIVFSGSMFINDDGYFYGGRWPQLGDEYVIKDYVDSLVSGSVANSGSFYALTDTPSVGTEGRVLFEGESPSSVQDSANLTFINNFLNLSGILHFTAGSSFSSLNVDESEIGYFNSIVTADDVAREGISSGTTKMEMKAKVGTDEVILFSRYNI